MSSGDSSATWSSLLSGESWTTIVVILVGVLIRVVAEVVAGVRTGAIVAIVPRRVASEVDVVFGVWGPTRFLRHRMGSPGGIATDRHVFARGQGSEASRGKCAPFQNRSP